jgi:hypothetical protein
MFLRKSITKIQIPTYSQQNEQKRNGATQFRGQAVIL